MQANITHRVFDKINKENIQIKPKIYFQLHFFLWIGMAGIFFILSALSLGYIFHYEREMHFMLLMQQDVSAFFSLFPWFHVLLSGVLIYISSRCYRKSRMRCRHDEWALLGALFLLVLVTAAVLINLNFIRSFYSQVIHVNKSQQTDTLLRK
jgi:hypothetical protein